MMTLYVTESLRSGKHPAFKESFLDQRTFTERPNDHSISDARPVVTCQACRNLQWDEEIASENIAVKMTEWRFRMKLIGRNPSVRISPMPSNC